MGQVSPHFFVLNALSQIEPFSGLSQPVLDMIAQGTRVRQVSQGELLVCRGDKPSGMYVVVRGEVKLTLGNSNGNERIVRLAGSGASFCEESVFGDSAQPLSAQVRKDGIVLFIPERVLQLAITSDIDFARAMMRRLSERISQLVCDMEQCEQRNGAQRVAHYLIKHASRASDAIEVKLSTTKQTIASQLNMSPESLSRVLNQFKREGYILPKGHRAIRLTDFDRLQRLAA